MMEIIERIEKIIPSYIIGSDGKLTECSKEGLGLTNRSVSHLEGGIREVILEIRKRDPKIRREALENYESICSVCEHVLLQMKLDKWAFKISYYLNRIPVLCKTAQEFDRFAVRLLSRTRLFYGLW